MVRGVSDGFMEAFQPFLTVYASDPNCKVNLGAISNKESGDCTPLVMAVIRAAATPDPPSPPPIRPSSTTPSSIRWPASCATGPRPPASTASTPSPACWPSPQTAVLPDDPRYRMFQGMKPITGVDTGERGLRRIAARLPGRRHRRVGAGEEEDHRHRRHWTHAGKPAHADPAVREGGRRPAVLARGIEKDHGSHRLRHRSRAPTRSSWPFSRLAFAPPRCAGVEEIPVPAGEAPLIERQMAAVREGLSRVCRAR